MQQARFSSGLVHPYGRCPCLATGGKPWSRSEPFILAAPLSRKNGDFDQQKHRVIFFGVLSTCRHPILGLVSATSESTHISMAALTWPPPGWLLQPNLLAGIAPDRSFFLFSLLFYAILPFLSTHVSLFAT